MKRCRLCYGTNIHCGGVHAAALRQRPLQSRYLCPDCDSRFWVFTEAAKQTALAGACAGIAMALLLTPPVGGTEDRGFGVFYREAQGSADPANTRDAAYRLPGGNRDLGAANTPPPMLMPLQSDPAAARMD